MTIVTTIGSSHFHIC